MRWITRAGEGSRAGDRGSGAGLGGAGADDVVVDAELSRCVRHQHRHSLLELDALLGQIESLVAEGDRARFDTDDRYRWILHRLWIAVGNEALAYVRLAGLNPHVAQPWARLYRLRNMLAHDRLPDIDEDEV